MAYVVAASWRSHPGKTDRLLEVIEEMTRASRAEPACSFYQAHRSDEDPNLFFLYEQYESTRTRRDIRPTWTPSTSRAW